jgi:hypothetical protein
LFSIVLAWFGASIVAALAVARFIRPPRFRG